MVCVSAPSLAPKSLPLCEGFRCGPARCPFIRPPDRPFPTGSFSDFNFLPTHVLLVGPSWVPPRGVKMPLHQVLFSFPFRIYLPYTPCQPSSSSLSLPQSFRYVGFLELLSCIYIPANVKPVHNVINPSIHLYESCCVQFGLKVWYLQLLNIWGVLKSSQEGKGKSNSVDGINMVCAEL